MVVIYHHFYQFGVYMYLINCPTCGKRISVSDKKCPYCGFELADFLRDKPSHHNLKKRNILLFSGILLTFCILCTIVISVITYLGDENISDNSIISDTYPDDFKKYNTKSSAALQITNTTQFAGVYMGDEHAMLILSVDGTAHYYSNEVAYTDINCSWNISESNVNVYLEKLHCTISADTASYPKLVFTSDSSNWESEEYEKVDVDPDSYLKRTIVTNDQSAYMLSDGRLHYEISGLSFILPKYFCDTADALDSDPHSSVFIDVDVSTDFTGTVFFNDNLTTYSEDLSSENAGDIFISFASRFVDNPSFSKPEAVTVAGLPAYKAYLENATYKKSYYSFVGYQSNGYIVIIPKNDIKKNIIIFFCQTSDRKRDDTDGFYEILESASILQ